MSSRRRRCLFPCPRKFLPYPILPAPLLTYNKTYSPDTRPSLTRKDPAAALLALHSHILAFLDQCSPTSAPDRACVTHLFDPRGWSPIPSEPCITAHTVPASTVTTATPAYHTLPRYRSSPDPAITPAQRTPSWNATTASSQEAHRRKTRLSMPPSPQTRMPPGTSMFCVGIYEHARAQRRWTQCRRSGRMSKHICNPIAPFQSPEPHRGTYQITIA